MSRNATTVPSWFKNQNILVTGATGFMGKVLIEKLLRCCPNVDTIFLLIRTKKDVEPQRRLKEFIGTPVFDTIRNDFKLLQKLRCISGDVSGENLNLSLGDLEELREKVTVVFHMAANVRFDQSLKTALLMNTGGTMNVLNLAQTFVKLKAFVHVSTSYCHCDQTELKEIVYSAPHDPTNLLGLANWMDEDTLSIITPKLIQTAPNTYAYTKCLTEELVVKYYSNVIPIAIVRPSIVSAAWKEPKVGWVDNLHGPTGILVGAGKGVIRSMHCNEKFQADIVPVDVCINAIILTAFQLGTSEKKSEPLVVNITASHDNPVTWGEALEMGRKHVYEYPFSVCLWYPGGSIKSNYFVHLLAVFFFHTIPAYFIDLIMILTGNKPFLVKTQKRIQNGLEILQYYTTRPWKFHNDNMRIMATNLNDEDRRVFYTDTRDLNWNSYLLAYILGARKYCVREDLDTLPHARKMLKRLYYMHLTKNFILCLFAVWSIYYLFHSIFL